MLLAHRVRRVLGTLRTFSPSVHSGSHGASRTRSRTLQLVLLMTALLIMVLVARQDRNAGAVAAVVPFTRAGPPVADSGRMQVVVVAQRRDCEGNLSFASYFTRSRLRGQVVVRQLLVEGSAADTIGLRPRLPTALRGVRMSLLESRERETLRAMGHLATPVFLLLDAESRLVAAIPVDPDPVHRIAFLRSITHLVTRDPKP